jgi:dipeptidyl aminopeptidase/acylaminoacyl peptidase
MLPPFERFFAVRSFQPTLAFAPDGASIYFSSNISGQFNLWRVPVEGGWPEQLTSYHDRTVRQVVVRAGDEAIVFAADHDGDEFHQLYVLERDRWPLPLTDAAQVQHALASTAFSPDGSRLAYGANARKPSDMEVWVRALDGDARPVFGEGMLALPGAWAPDGARLLGIEFRSITDQSIHLVQVDGAAAEELTPHEEPAKFEPGPWQVDGSGFFFLTDSGAEFSGLAHYDLDARRWSYVEQPDRDVMEVALSPDGRVLAWIENDRGWATLRLRDLGSGAELPAPRLPRGTTFVFGSALTFSPDGRHLALLWDQSRRVEEIYVVDTATGEARRLTDSRTGAPLEDELVEPELVSVPSPDGHRIPAWLYPGAGDGPRPVVLNFHGGPEAQERPGYKPFMQYLCSRGITVVAPNIRGSTGYGRTYQRLIYKEWGRGDLRDFEAVAEWVRAQEWADPARLGVAGGSYGGFATLTCLARLPDLWAVGVDAFGPSNLISLIETVPPTWWRLTRELIGDPEADREQLLAGSPITYVDEIRAPLLVVQGAKDPRVVPAESERIVERLRELGRDVEYELFEDEGHGFTRHENELRAWRLFAGFLERHLVPVAAGAQA